MTGTLTIKVRTFHFMPQHLHLPLHVGDSCNHFLSIFDNQETILDQPWRIRALKSYSTLVFIQRKIKIWLLRKRVLALRTLVPVGSFVLRNIFSFLSPTSVYPHPTILVTEKQGIHHAICQVQVLPCVPQDKRTSFINYHVLHTFTINIPFTLTYNKILYSTAFPPLTGFPWLCSV